MSIKMPIKSGLGRMLVPVALVAGLVSIAPVQAADAGKATKPMPAEQRKAIESVVHDYLINHPSVLREAIEAMQKREEAQAVEQAAQKLKQHSAELFNDPTAPVGGNPKGDVTVVEFFDYQCGFCKRVAPAVEALIEQDRNVRVVYKQFAILGPQSSVAARAALASARQGKYEAYHRALMAAESVDDESLKRLAEQVGLDYAQLQKDMEDSALNTMLEANFQLATGLGITGTPTFVIGDRVIPGAASTEQLADAVNQARKATK